MLNRATVTGIAIAIATTVVAVLVWPVIGPRASRADLGSPSISIEDLHRQVDHGKLPVHVAPEP
jgi:hypothetical protein